MKVAMTLKKVRIGNYAPLINKTAVLPLMHTSSGPFYVSRLKYYSCCWPRYREQLHAFNIWHELIIQSYSNRQLYFCL